MYSTLFLLIITKKGGFKMESRYIECLELEYRTLIKEFYNLYKKERLTLEEQNKYKELLRALQSNINKNISRL